MELQSQGGGEVGTSVERDDGSGIDRSVEVVDETSHVKHSTTNAQLIDISGDGEGDTTTCKVEENYDGSPSTLGSSNGWFELVSTPTSEGVESLDTLSSDETETDLKGSDDVSSTIDESDNNQRLRLNADDATTDDATTDDAATDDAATTTNAASQTNPLTSPNQTDPETIIQCLLRLQKERTLYKGASHMATTLMISNFIFFYALQVTKRTLTSISGDEGDYHQQKENVLNLLKNSSLQHHQRIHNSILFTIVRHLITDILQIPSYIYFLLPKSKIGTSLLASSLAGAINVFLTNPLWVASLRIMESKVPLSSSATPDKGEGGSIKQHKQKQQQPTLWAVIHGIATKEGIPQLWSGTLTSLLLVSNPIIQHFLYDHLRVWLFERRRRHNTAHSGGDGRHGRDAKVFTTLTPVEAFAFGALSKTVATVVTYPLQLAQVLLRLQSKKLPSTPDGKDDHTTSHEATATVEYNGMIDCLYQQFTAGGVPAMFKGMNAKLLQTVLTAAFTFLTYEQTLVLVGRLYNSLK